MCCVAGHTYTYDPIDSPHGRADEHYTISSDANVVPKASGRANERTMSNKLTSEDTPPTVPRPPNEMRISRNGETHGKKTSPLFQRARCMPSTEAGRLKLYFVE
ncbi:RNA helicase [Anopheles sinensis]|uniref:RNA helicase n=1 Tax=Anopheles sinensis TaxID=74873 RepID=A0A084WRB8_ANOSI|nr:RNA helicase [Anopheles sinensis]